VKAAAPAKTSTSSAKNGKGTKTPISVLPPPMATPLRVNKPVVDEVTIEVKSGPVKMTPFLKKQKQRLIELRSTLFESMEGMAQETIRSRPEGSDASVGGMHMGDAGSDAYDRDFALSLLSKEQDALYEINEALKRIDLGTYGLCELSGKKINEERLEALPFTRYTREMQEQVERDQFGGKNRRVPVRSVFGLEGDDEDEDGDDEEAPAANTQQSESSLDFMKE
jgi:RNA polymerase-binding transcription factor DksA